MLAIDPNNNTERENYKLLLEALYRDRSHLLRLYPKVAS